MTVAPKATHNSGPNLNKPGLKECADIILAAVAQGCRFEEACGRKAHARLLPPSGPPIIVGSTPSTGIERRYLISRLKRGGFGFQWPPPESKKVARVQTKREHQMSKSMSITIPPGARLLSVVGTGGEQEIWHFIERYSDYEISNGGRARETYGHRPLTPTAHGTVVLVDDDGNEREKSLVALCKKAFGHHPKKGLILDEPSTQTEETDDEEETPVTQAQYDNEELGFPLPPDEELDSGQQDEAQRDHEAGVRWEPVLIEGVVEGYEVTADAAVMGPETSKGRRLLVPSPGSPVRRRTVQLRRLDGKYRGYPLDEIVLEAFVARPTTGGLWVPEHIDGDQSNCKLTNLRWTEIIIEPEEPAVPESTFTGAFVTEGVPEIAIPEEPAVIVHDHAIDAVHDVLVESDPEVYGTPVLDPGYTFVTPATDPDLFKPITFESITLDDDARNLPVRVYNLLKRGGYRTYGDLANVTASRLLTERGWMNGDIEKLIWRMEQLGLTLERGDMPTSHAGISVSSLYTHDATGTTVIVNKDGTLDHKPITLDTAAVYAEIFACIQG